MDHNKAISKSNKLIILSLAVIASLFEFLGISLIYPFLDLVFELNAVPSNYFEKVFAVLDTYQITDSKLIIGASIILLIFFKGFINAFYRYYLNVVVHKWIIRFREETYQKLFKTDVDQVSQSISRIYNALTKQSEISGGAINTKYNIVQILINTSFLVTLGFLISFKGFILSLVLCALIYLIFTITYKISKKLGVKYANTNEKFYNLTNEILSNFNYLRSTNSFYKFKDNIFSYIKNISQSVINYGLVTHTTKALTEPIILLSLMIIFYVNINYLKIDISSILLLYAVLIKTFSNILSAIQRYQQYNNDLAAVEYCSKIYGELKFNNQLQKNSNIINNIEKIELKNLDISVHNKKNLRIKNLKLEKNKIILIIGESGTGKSTLINSILGLYKNYSGKIFFNNFDIEKINHEEIKNKIGYISQEITMFNLSLRENLTFRSKNIDDKQLIKLIEKFDLKKIFQNNKIDLDLKINQLKSNLSGGEKQRISFLREIIINPDFMILDEATSALDSENIERFKSYLLKNKSNMALLIISHQKNFFNISDEIYEIQNEELVKIK